MNDTLLGWQDIAEYLGIGQNKARTLLQTIPGAFPVKGGKTRPQYRIRESDFVKWVDKQSCRGRRRC